MRKVALATAVLLASTSAAHAATATAIAGSSVTFPGPAGTTTTFDGSTPFVAPGFALTLGPGASVITGTTGTSAAPFIGGGPFAGGDGRDNTPYLSVLGGTGNFAQLLSATGYTSVSLYWGSVDDFNFVDLLNSAGNVFDTFSGITLNPNNGNQGAAQRVTLTSSAPIYGVRFRSNQNSFELDNVYFTGAVPEPAAWAMMLIGFGFVGTALRRRRQSVRVSFA